MPVARPPLSVRPSDVALLLAPIALGFGSARLLAPRTYRRCGKVPSLQPPGWAFGAGWTALYLLAGASAALAWRRSGRRWTHGLSALSVALVALMAWWVVFANRCAPALAFAAIVPAAGSVVAAAALMLADGAAASAALLLPLVAWMAFASYLSFSAAS